MSWYYTIFNKQLNFVIISPIHVCPEDVFGKISYLTNSVEQSSTQAKIS